MRIVRRRSSPRHLIRHLFACSILAAALAFGPQSRAADTPMTCNIPAVVAQALPATVNITVVRILPKPPARPGAPASETLGIFFGSGFIISPDGLIVTNRHVIQDAAIIRVTLQNKEEVPGQLVAAASGIDLAVLKVNLPHKLPTIAFGNSDALELGQRVIAIGNPLGVGTSISTGVVSAENRNLMRTPFDDYLQTDASINPGNSGGPLIDCSGHVIGVNTYLLSNNAQLGSIGLGFALTSNDVSYVASVLQHPDRVPTWIGLDLQDLTDMLSKVFDRPNMNGAIVAGVAPGGPAAGADIRTGDIITTLNGQPVGDSRAIQREIAQLPSNQPISLTVWRNGHTNMVTVRGQTWPNMMALREQVLASPQAILRAENAGLGLQVSAITEADRKRFDLGAAQGVLIDKVVPGSQADTMSFHAGDVIEQIDAQPAPNLQQVTSQLMISGKTPGKLVALLVREQSGPKWRTLWVGRINPADIVANLMAGSKATVGGEAAAPKK